jgi:hypothetical protein
MILFYTDKAAVTDLRSAHAKEPDTVIGAGEGTAVNYALYVAVLAVRTANDGGAVGYVYGRLRAGNINGG